MTPNYKSAAGTVQYGTVTLALWWKRQVYLELKYLFNIPFCSTDWDRLRILQPIRLSARSLSGHESPEAVRWAIHSMSASAVDIPNLFAQHVSVEEETPPSP